MRGIGCHASRRREAKRQPAVVESVVRTTPAISQFLPTTTLIVLAPSTASAFNTFNTRTYHSFSQAEADPRARVSAPPSTEWESERLATRSQTNNNVPCVKASLIGMLDIHLFSDAKPVNQFKQSVGRVQSDQSLPPKPQPLSSVDSIITSSRVKITACVPESFAQVLRIMRTRKVFIVLALPLLWSCSKHPPSAREMLATFFPADGILHIQRKGRFTITKHTNVCVYRPGFSLDPEIMRQAVTSRGGMNVQDIQNQTNRNFGRDTIPECEGLSSKQAIFSRTLQENSRYGGPYKVALIAWQDAAVWVGVVERRNGLRADAQPVNPPMADGPALFGPTTKALDKKEHTRHSIEMDVRNLSQVFFTYTAKLNR